MDLRILFNAVTMEYNYRLHHMGKYNGKKYSWFQPDFKIVNDYLCIPENVYADTDGIPHVAGLAVTERYKFTPASFVDNNGEMIICDWSHFCRTDCFGTLLNFFDLINPERRDSTMFHVIPLYYGGIEDASVKGGFTLASFKEHQEDRLELLLNGLISNIKSFNKDVKKIDATAHEIDFTNAKIYQAGLQAEFTGAIVNYAGITDCDNWLVGILSEPELADYLLEAYTANTLYVRNKKLSVWELIFDSLVNIVDKYHNSLSGIINKAASIDNQMVLRELLDRVDERVFISNSDRLTPEAVDYVSKYVLESDSLRHLDVLFKNKAKWLTAKKTSVSDIISHSFYHSGDDDFNYLIGKLDEVGKPMPSLDDYKGVLGRLVCNGQVMLVKKAISALEKNNLTAWMPPDTDSYVACTVMLLGNFASKKINDDELYNSFMILMELMNKFNINLDSNWTPDLLIKSFYPGAV